MKCSSCGWEVESGAKFCPSCGLEQGGTSELRKIEYTKELLSEAKKKRTEYDWTGGILGGLGTGGLFWGIHFIIQSSKCGKSVMDTPISLIGSTYCEDPWIGWLIVAGGAAFICIAIGFLIVRNRYNNRVKALQRQLHGTEEMMVAADTPGDITPDEFTPEIIRCPICGSDTVIRTAKRGPNVGDQFHVCTRYPECEGKIAVE